MIKTIVITIEFIAEGNSKKMIRIVDDIPDSIQIVKEDFDEFISKYGDFTIPGTSAL